MELEELLEEMAEELEPELELVPSFLKTIGEIDKPLSVFSTISFLPKIESIRIGIFSVLKSEEFYSANILFRSLIEHFVKAQYLWMKTVEQKGDEIGIDFWVFGTDQEHIDYARNLHQSYVMLGIEPISSPNDVLEEMGILSEEKSRTQIRKKTDQFKYKNMVHFIANSLKFREKGSAPLFDGIFPRYSSLSSYVHGGPQSVFVTGEKPEDQEELLESSTFASLYTRRLTYLLMYQFDKNIEPLFHVATKYMVKFSET